MKKENLISKIRQNDVLIQPDEDLKSNNHEMHGHTFENFSEGSTAQSLAHFIAAFQDNLVLGQHLVLIIVLLIIKFNSLAHFSSDGVLGFWGDRKSVV